MAVSPLPGWSKAVKSAAWADTRALPLFFLAVSSARALFSGLEACPEQACGPLERWVAQHSHVAWAAASRALCTMLRCGVRVLTAVRRAAPKGRARCQRLLRLRGVDPTVVTSPASLGRQARPAAAPPVRTWCELSATHVTNLASEPAIINRIFLSRTHLRTFVCLFQVQNVIPPLEHQLLSLPLLVELNPVESLRISPRVWFINGRQRERERIDLC